MFTRHPALPTRPTHLARRPWQGLGVVAATTLLATTALVPAAVAAPTERARATAPAPAPSYTLTELDAPPGGTASFGLGLSPQGDPVGTARTSAARSPQLATRWTDGEPTVLGSLPGSSFSRAFAQNARGEAVGEATAANGSTRAVLFARDGAVRDLGTLEGSSSAVAGDINARGTAVGVSAGTPIVFGKDGAVALPPLEQGVSGISRADAVNDRGQVAGFAPATVEGEQRPVGQAVRWTPRGRDYVATGLDRLAAGRFARAYDVNAGGTAVGEAGRDDDAGRSVTRAVRWEGTAVQELPAVDEFRFTRPNAVGNDGDVVGNAGNFFGFPTFGGTAVLWRDGVAHDLNDLVTGADGFVLRSAEDVDERGRIVGFGSVDGETRAFLLTPAPSERARD